MGRPQRKQPRRAVGTTRREFFKRSGSAAMVVAAGTSLHLGSALAASSTAQIFQHGVASVSHVQSFGIAFEVQNGTNRLAPSAQTTPRPTPAAPAP